MPDPCAWQSKAVMRIVTRAKRRCLRTHLTITFALLAVGCAGIPDDALLRASDAPDRRQARAVVFGAPSSYADALAQWRSPESINAWIAANFEYDNRRALALSESARSTAGHIKIHEPEVFYVAPVGVCVDLANFAVSALRAVAPDLHPSFLLIEFEPVRVAGQTLRRHWLASYRQDGAFYFFADSKRPGHIAGLMARSISSSSRMPSTGAAPSSPTDSWSPMNAAFARCDHRRFASSAPTVRSDTDIATEIHGRHS